MARLTNEERCLIHNLSMEKHWDSERIVKMFSDKWAHLTVITCKCWNCSNSKNIFCFAV